MDRGNTRSGTGCFFTRIRWSKYVKKTRQIIFLAFLANNFECLRLLIGCSSESTNQKSLIFKKNHYKRQKILEFEEFF